jgi:hypothetical protein
MATNKGVNNAQNNIIGQDNNGHLEGDVFGGPGAVATPAFNPTTGFMWTGTGQTNTGYVSSTDGNIQTAEKINHRTDGDYTPTINPDNGRADYTVNAGTQIGNPARAEWNWNYVDNVAAGTPASDSAGLAALPDLGQYDLKMLITESRPGFIHHSDVFDFNAANHVWTAENTLNAGGVNKLAFGGDDFAPGNLAPTGVQSHVTENSENVAFLQGANATDGFGTLPGMTAAGTQWDFKEAVFQGGTGHMLSSTDVHVLIAASSV